MEASLTSLGRPSQDGQCGYPNLHFELGHENGDVASMEVAKNGCPDPQLYSQPEAIPIYSALSGWD
jgi:hypothetical protein